MLKEIDYDLIAFSREENLQGELDFILCVLPSLTHQETIDFYNRQVLKLKNLIRLEQEDITEVFTFAA